MIETAHFIQFLGFSLGLVAIYIVFQMYRQSGLHAIKTYGWILLGINIIVFVHVLEAFFKIIIPVRVFSSYFGPALDYMIIPLGAIRLFIAFQFMYFVKQLKNQKVNFMYRSAAYFFFGLFTIILLFFRLGILYYSSLKNTLTFSIHLALAVVIVTGSSQLFYSAKYLQILQPRAIKLLSVFFLFYATLNFLLRLVNFPDKRISDDSQMLGIGLLALIFNLTHVVYLRRLFHDRNANQHKQQEINTLFIKYKITRREQDIIRGICKGKTNKEIAEELFITPVTVRDHLSNIYRKTAIKNRTQLATLFRIDNTLA